MAEFIESIFDMPLLLCRKDEREPTPSMDANWRRYMRNTFFQDIPYPKETGGRIFDDGGYTQYNSASKPARPFVRNDVPFSYVPADSFYYDSDGIMVTKDGRRASHLLDDVVITPGEKVNKELPLMDTFRTMPTNEEACHYADWRDSTVVPHIGDFIGAAIKPLDAAMPSRWVGLLDSDNNNGLLHLFDDDNRGLFINDSPYGFFSKRYAEEHPYWAMAGNLAGDIAAGYGIGKGVELLTNNWGDRSEVLAKAFGKEGKTWAKVTDDMGNEGIVFLNNHTKMKTAADWGLHPIRTYKEWRKGWYPMTKQSWKDYLTKEREMMETEKDKSIQLNDEQLKTRWATQKQETKKDRDIREVSATIRINDNPQNPFGYPRLPRNASEVANNVKVISSNKATSYGGKYFSPNFVTKSYAAESLPSEATVVIPRHNMTKFSNRMLTSGFYSPLDSRGLLYGHELQHQMQLNLPFLKLAEFNPISGYYDPFPRFLKKVGEESLFDPFYNNAQYKPGSWNASPKEYNAESNAYRIMDEIKGRRNMFEPLDEWSADRLNGFGLNFNQINRLWELGYKDGGKLK